jgi:hypothetical protein
MSLGEYTGGSQVPSPRAHSPVCSARAHEIA